MNTSDFDYSLPAELIAQHPTPERDQSRLLVVHRDTGLIEHRRFPDISTFMGPNDTLVMNNSRVIPARLRAVHAKTPGRKFELLLLQNNGNANDWWSMIRPGRRAPAGTEIVIQSREGSNTKIHAIVTDINAEGHRRLLFSGINDISSALDELGEIPLPPYIHRENPNQLEADKIRYQTVYANAAGSVAAPTAGLHFTPGLLDAIRERGARICFVTLHVGLGTFAPVKTDNVADHVMHQERFEVSGETASMVNDSLDNKRRVIAVGTTSVRVLETLARQNSGRIAAGTGSTNIFIHPPAQFEIVSALLTNFHLPKSTLLMLVSAFASPGETQGRELILRAYDEAVRERYRFFSYGDAMLIL